MDSIEDVIRSGAVRAVFQPIVDLDAGTVVAYEALARGPQGPLERPDLLFGAARRADCLAELDQACRRAALRDALARGIGAPLTLFVNVEPEVLDAATLEQLLDPLGESGATDTSPGVVLEITERALGTRPAELLRTVERVRAFGWSVALDDVGAESLSLAFMPLLRPEVVKLDLKLVQQRPGPAVAGIMNAVNAYAERTGAVVLAEGIENEQHLAVAWALGARLGQGWLFGRPADGPAPALPVGALALPPARRVPTIGERSPFSCLPEGVPLRVSAKPLLIELSKHLEREAGALGETCVVVGAFQHARHFTPATAERYRGLADAVGFVAALGEGLEVEPARGVRGAQLAADDQVRGEWDLVVLAPHFAAALLARDLGDSGPDRERRFEFALTYDRDVVVEAGSALLRRVVPQLPIPGADPERLPAPARLGGGLSAVRETHRDVARAAAEVTSAEALLRRALSATRNGVAIADVTRPDQPLVYVNTAFERLVGMRAEEVIGRNCRFLQGPDTDPAAVSRIRAAMAQGRECRETLLNYRVVRGSGRRMPWWNEIFLAPVFDDTGRVVQYIGVQNDVSERVAAVAALREERDRAQSYLERIQELAFTDPLTGLPNRRRLEEQLDLQMWEARASGDGLALLYVDLDHFKAVNDTLGHAAGDELLSSLADRMRGQLRRGDLIARLGGDEFLVALPRLDPDRAGEQAEGVAAKLRAALGEPTLLRGSRVAVTVSIGVSLYPTDGTSVDQLLHTADTRMYAAKTRP